MSDKAKPPADMTAATVLVVLGLVLPLAGIAWGPGSTWAYLLWIALGAAVVWVYGYTHEFTEDGSE